MPIYMEDIAINRKEQHGSVLPTRIIYDLSKPSTLFSNDFKQCFSLNHYRGKNGDGGF